MWPRVVLLSMLLAALFAAESQAQRVERRPLDPVQVRISDADCRWLARHRPASDVEYKPGTSTTGKPVVPADLGGRPPLALPEVYSFSIGREIVGLPGNTQANLAVGTVLFDTVGQRLTFNGQPLSTPLQDELVLLCRERVR